MDGKRDAELLRLYAHEHSEAAFSLLGRRYAGLVYATCLREIGEQTQAEDAAQAVFLLLSQKAGTLTRYDTLAGWLYTASCFTCRNMRRQQNRRNAAEGKAVMAQRPEPAANELWERIEPHFHHALNRLKPVDREAILLRYVQELSLSEVGTCLGLSENTTRMRVNRALEKIRSHLGKAGVVIGMGTLAAVLDRHAAVKAAAPPSVLAAIARISTSETPVRAIKLVGKSLSLFPKYTVVTVCGLLILGGSGLFVSRWLLPHPTTIAEQKRLLASLSGTWQGTITFVDDRSRKQYTYPTRVRISLDNAGQMVQMVSTYMGSPEEDVMRFTDGGRTGEVSVRNGGARPSHTLDAVGEMVQERGGGLTFHGQNRANTSQTQIQIVPNGRHLTVREAYRPAPSWSWQGIFSSYRLRNQYALERVP